MAERIYNPSEHSPLLPKPIIQIHEEQTHLPVHPSGSIENFIAQGADSEVSETINSGISNGDIESQPGHEGEPTQYAGLPEVRNVMIYVFPAIAIGVFLAAADGTIIMASYGKIGSELDALNKTSWIANAYFLTLTAFQPLYGKLSDIFGRRACLLFAYLVFGVGCLFCGLAQDINQLIASRAFAGIGGGGMTTIVSILLSDIVPLRERGTWQGYINIVYATGSATGAPLGGIIADYISWRWAFLLQVPVCFLSFFAVFYFLHLPNRDQGHWKAKLARIDFLGAVILLFAVSATLVGLDRGSNVSWTSKVTIICLALSIPLFVLFLIVEVYIAAEPFAPGHIILDKSLIAAYLCNFFALAGWLAGIFYIPLHFQAVYNMSATKASILLIPSIICGVSGSLFAGFYMQRTGHYYWLTLICYSFLVIGMIMIVIFSGAVVPFVPGMVIGMMICAFNSGTGITSTLIAIIANTNPDDQAVATACSYLFRSMGSVFGLAISATVVNQMLRTFLQHDLGGGEDVDKIADMVRRSLDTIKTLDPAVRDIVRECYAKSTRVGFSVEVFIVLGAAISAIFVKETLLDK